MGRSPYLSRRAASRKVSPLLNSPAWAQLRAWYSTHGRHALPWRCNRTPWRVLLAETVLHRTQASIASPIYEKLVCEFPGPESVVAKPQRWRELLWPAGLAWRAQAFVDACKALTEEYVSEIPADRAVLESLPGV